MYGVTAGSAGGTLAATGAMTGSMLLTAIGMLLAGSALVLLARKPAKHRP